MSVAIYTITHVPFTPPKDSTYLPLQVGCATHPSYGYLCDNTGENISDKNQYYSELTGLYWIWKQNADADYLGLCHYRRYFLNADGELMKAAEYEQILSEYDVMVSKSRLGEYDYRTIYARSHDIRNLDATGEVIRELYPDYYATFQEVIADNHCYVGNLFVAPKELFYSYCEWLFTIFFALEKRIDVEHFDDYHKRVFGFLSEQLLIVWIKHNKLSYFETDFGLSQEKAETIALKQTLKEMIAQKEVEKAYSHLCATLDKRPDLLLEMSDFHQDLKWSEHLLNMCRIEKESSIDTLLSFSTDLDVLLKHCRLLLQILENIQNNTVKEKELQYLTDCHISKQALVYLIQNFKQIQKAPIQLLNQLASVYAGTGDYLTSLSFLEEALHIQETNAFTLSNIIAVFENMGQPEFAAEYKKRIVVFTGSDIPILNYIAKQYSEAFAALGHTVFVFDMQQFEASMESLFLFQAQGLSMAVLFNNACFQMRLSSGESLWDMWKVPCYNILVDHPMYYFDTLDSAPSYGIVCCADKYHTDYIKRFYPSVQNTLFLPTAGECCKTFEQLKPYENRTIDLLFIGSYKYHDDILYDDFDKQLEQALLACPSKTFEQTIIDCLSQNNVQLDAPALKDFIQKHRFVDVNTTSLFRKKIIETLVFAGIKVTVYGNGWETLDVFHHPNFCYQGLIAPQDGIALMEECKIVLNHMAWFKAGASERIYEAMLQGAVSLTDESDYLKESFQDRMEIAFFSLSDLEALPIIVKQLLSDTALCNQIRKQAYQKAAESGTWLNRAATLLETL